MASLTLSEIEFQQLGYGEDRRFILFADITPLEDKGMGIYQDCNNVVGVVTSDELRRMVLRAIKVAAGFDPLFAALLADDSENPSTR